MKMNETGISISTVATIIGSFVVFVLGAIFIILKGFKSDLNRIDDKKVDKGICEVKHGKGN